MADVVESVTVSTSLAHRLIAAAEEKAAALGLQVSIAICDPSGALKAVSRMDGATAAAFEGSVGKSRTAAIFEEPNDAWLTVNPAVNAGVVGGDRLIFFPGGKPIVVDGRIVGAIGVAGGHYQQDSEIAAAALEAVGYPAAPTPLDFDGWR
jgi:uncharacterized protein GlcG (DUF336 family)